MPVAWIINYQALTLPTYSYGDEAVIIIIILLEYSQINSWW